MTIDKMLWHSDGTMYNKRWSEQNLDLQGQNHASVGVHCRARIKGLTMDIYRPKVRNVPRPSGATFLIVRQISAVAAWP